MPAFAAILFSGCHPAMRVSLRMLHSCNNTVIACVHSSFFQPSARRAVDNLLLSYQIIIELQQRKTGAAADVDLFLLC